jgi:hypothetical protein
MPPHVATAVHDAVRRALGLPVTALRHAEGNPARLHGGALPPAGARLYSFPLQSYGSGYRIRLYVERLRRGDRASFDCSDGRAVYLCAYAAPEDVFVFFDPLAHQPFAYFATVPVSAELVATARSEGVVECTRPRGDRIVAVRSDRLPEAIAGVPHVPALRPRGRGPVDKQRIAARLVAALNQAGALAAPADPARVPLEVDVRVDAHVERLRVYPQTMRPHVSGYRMQITGWGSAARVLHVDTSDGRAATFVGYEPTTDVVVLWDAQLRGAVPYNTPFHAPPEVLARAACGEVVVAPNGPRSGTLVAVPVRGLVDGVRARVVENLRAYQELVA